MPPTPRLLVVRLSALGDVIHTVPAVLGLRKAFDIEWVVETPYASLVENVGEVRAIPVSLRQWSGRRIAAARRAVRGAAVAVDFQGLVKSALVARASGAPVRFGFAPGLVREKPAAWLTNRHVRFDPTSHVVEWNLALAAAVSTSGGATFEPPASGEVAEAFRRFASGPPAPERSVVLLPGAGRPNKLWPVESFRAVARHFGQRSLVVWGPGEEERAHAIGAPMAPPTDLAQLTRHLADAALVIGADTGPLHLAAALGTPVVALFGPTNPHRNGPYGQLDRVVSTFGTSRRMEDVAPAEVVAMAERVLG